MKLAELRQIIKEELEEILGTEPANIPGAPEMARIASNFKLVDDWKEKIVSYGKMLDATKTNLIARIENAMKRKGEQGLDPTVLNRSDLYSKQEDTASFQLLTNPDKLGILKFYDKPAPKEKPVSSGIRGRIPVDVNIKLEIVMSALNKFKNGEELTDNEKKVVSRALNKTIQ
jgi:hypothetical protein